MIFLADQECSAYIICALDRDGGWNERAKHYSGSVVFSLVKTPLLSSPLVCATLKILCTFYIVKHKKLVNPPSFVPDRLIRGVLTQIPLT